MTTDTALGVTKIIVQDKGWPEQMADKRPLFTLQQS
jgi:hypothetical protein